MTIQKTPYLLAFLSTCLLGSAAALADPPATSVTFDYRVDPMNSQSEVSFSVTLHLAPTSINGSSVGWQITSAEFHQPESDRLWTTGNVSVIGGSGGLWWVTHADTNSPVASEFTAIPHIEGTAECSDEQVADLNFEMQQGTTELEPGQYPFGNQTGFSTHSFQLTGEPQPEVAGENEPIDLGSNPS